MLFRVDDTKLNLSFNDGIETFAQGPEISYYVEVEEFLKKESSPLIVENYHFSTNPHPHLRNRFRLPIKFYFDFQISVFKVILNHGLKRIFHHRYNDTGKLVKFIIDTDDKTEAKIWFDSVMKYCEINSCEKIIQSKFDDLNKHTNISYINKELEPYKTYSIGRYPKNSSDWKTVDPRKEGLIWFGNWKTFWSYEHPRCWKDLTSKEIADDILGLN